MNKTVCKSEHTARTNTLNSCRRVGNEVATPAASEAAALVIGASVPESHESHKDFPHGLTASCRASLALVAKVASEAAAPVILDSLAR